MLPDYCHCLESFVVPVGHNDDSSGTLKTTDSPWPTQLPEPVKKQPVQRSNGNYEQESAFASPFALSKVPEADVKMMSADNQHLDRSKVMKNQDTDISLLATCFHITIDQAASRLGICPTGLKKICRKHGIKRWPYRKLKSMAKHIDKLEVALHEETRSICGYKAMNMATQLTSLKEQYASWCFPRTSDHVLRV